MIKLDLTLNEVNAILQGLGNLPFATVFELIGKIKQQAEVQISQKAEETDDV